MKHLNPHKILLANMLLSSSMAYSAAIPGAVQYHGNPAAVRQMQLMEKSREAEQQELTYKQAEYLLKVVLSDADITADRFPAPGTKLKTQAKKREQEYNITGMHHLVAAGLCSAHPAERRRNLVVTLRKRCPKGFDLSALAQPGVHPVSQLAYIQGYFMDNNHDFSQLKIHLQSATLFLEEGQPPHTDPNKCWANAFVGLLHIENKRGQLPPSPDFTEQAECMRPAFPFLNAFSTWHQASAKHPFYSILNSYLVSDIYTNWGEVMYFLSQPINEVDHAVKLALKWNPDNRFALEMQQHQQAILQQQKKGAPEGSGKGFYEAFVGGGVLCSGSA